jgi:biotin carboxyl carrier protein
MGPVAEITRIGEGAYRVVVDGETRIVYVAGPPGDRWVSWNGHVYRGDVRRPAATARQRERVSARQSLSAPMPATVIRVLTQPGDAVKKGDVLVLLEAMKMELPIRAPADATVTAVLCRAGELVHADAILVELE